MTKKALGITLGIIALIAGVVLIAIGIQQIRGEKQERGILSKSEIEKAVTESMKENVAYRHPQTNVQLRYPKNWSVVPDEEGVGVSFSLYGGAVSLRLASDDLAKQEMPALLEEYTQTLMVRGVKEAAQQGVVIARTSDGPAALAGNPGHQWQYTITIGEIAGRGMQVWTLKDRRSYVFTYTAAKELFDAFTPVIQQMLASVVLP